MNDRTNQRLRWCRGTTVSKGEHKASGGLVSVKSPGHKSHKLVLYVQMNLAIGKVEFRLFSQRSAAVSRSYRLCSLIQSLPLRIGRLQASANNLMSCSSNRTRGEMRNHKSKMKKHTSGFDGVFKRYFSETTRIRFHLAPAAATAYGNDRARNEQLRICALPDFAAGAVLFCAPPVRNNFATFFQRRIPMTF
jgi:hypothetical protein